MPGGLDRLQDAERHAVIGDEEGVDLVVVGGQRVLGVGLRRLGLPGRRELIHDDLDVALGDQRIEHGVIALLHEGRAGLTGVAADQDVVALRHFRDDRLRRRGAAVLRIAADIAGLLGAENQIVVRGERNAGLCRLLGDRRGNMEIDRLDDDRVDALGDDVFGLRDLVLRIVLRRLNDDRVAGGLGRLLEERHVGVEVAEGRLLLQHEGDLVGLAGRAGSRGIGRARGQRAAAAIDARGERDGSRQSFDVIVSSLS